MLAYRSRAPRCTARARRQPHASRQPPRHRSVLYAGAAPNLDGRAANRDSEPGYRIWHGYSPYNPEVLAKLLDIYRVFYNFIHPGQDKRTPAMRLGLVRTVTNLEDVIGFQ